MEFGVTVTSRLPAPRDDEPPGLREAIADELADHLACSLQRELLRRGDPSAARAAVLVQFGDPAAVARRLWLDAMRGRIMAQRMLIGTCLFATVVCLALVGLFWQQSLHAQRMAADQVALAQARADQAAAREHELFNQLQQMTEAIKHPRSPDWNPVRMKLTEETKDGPPVAGVSVVLTRRFEDPRKMIRRVSDAAGLVDFGSINPGDYSFQASKSGEGWSLAHQGELAIEPGSDVTESLVCPKLPPSRVAVRVGWKLPADLENEGLYLYAPFTMRGRKLGPDNDWTIVRSIASTGGPGGGNQLFGMERIQAFAQGLAPAPGHRLLCGPSSETVAFKALTGPFLWTIQENNVWPRIAESAKLGPGDLAEIIEADLETLKPPGTPFEFEVGDYGLPELLVMRPTKGSGLEPGRRCYDLLAGVCARECNRRIHVAAKPPDGPYFQTYSGDQFVELLTSAVGSNTGMGRYFGFGLVPSTPTIDLPMEYWNRARNEFEAKPGQMNEWTIRLRDELIQAVREALKAEKAPKDKPAPKVEAVKGIG
jgi:hypothetical protein